MSNASDFFLAGAGSSFEALFYSGTLVSLLASATDVVITPTAGRRVVLDGLHPGTNVDRTGVTINGSVSGDIVSLLTLNAAGVNTTGQFVVGSTTAFGSVGNITHIVFKVDEVVTISTTDANSINIDYSYQEGL